MSSQIYVRLIGFTAGTLLQLFWMVVILGYRRQRNFERVFFFLCLALFCFYGGSLLALNAQIYYDQTPSGLRAFATTVITIGLCLVPALLMHVHMEFAESRGLLKDKRWKAAVAVFFYAASLHTLILSLRMRVAGGSFDFVLPGDSMSNGVPHIFSYALLWCSTWEYRFHRTAPDAARRRFHGLLTFVLLCAFAAMLALQFMPSVSAGSRRVEWGLTLSLLPLVPMVALIYQVWRHDFLPFGRQKNLTYAVSTTFLALLYLSLVRRVGGWLEPVLPPEASASILLFVLVIFIEPLQRVLGRRLQEAAAQGLDRAQRLSAELQSEARQGDLRRLIRLIERRVKEQFELETVRLTMLEPDLGTDFVSTGATHGFESLTIHMPGRLNAVLAVKPHGAMLSGDVQAALESLCQQLPSTVELCRAIQDKLQLAASISHNLKNPLGSIKTILQVQMENPELPVTIRGETQIVLDEVGRLSAKLNQLLQFSRPAVRSGGAGATCDVRTVIEDVVGVLRHEAEGRGVQLGSRISDGISSVETSAEALNEVISNLVVNALEATSQGGHVTVEVSWRGNQGCVISVEDDGVGIPAALREKVTRPFFTTKPKGTGLGLAIVARRVAEFGGKLEWVSPVREGTGTKFEVTLQPARANGPKE
jgi:signal transduction histidine kinase